MQPPARIRSVLLSDRRIFKQGLFIMKTVRGTLPRLVFFAANLIFKSKFSPAFWGRRRSQERVALVALRRARNLIPAFSFW